MTGRYPYRIFTAPGHVLIVWDIEPDGTAIVQQCWQNGTKFYTMSPEALKAQHESTCEWHKDEPEDA